MAKRPEKTDAEREDVELEGAESLLAKLKKQYRMMERNRRQYRDEATVLLVRQRKILSELQKEKGDLGNHLTAMVNPQNESRDQRTISTLASTLDRQTKYQQQIDEERDKISELDGSIAAAEKKVRESRRRVPSARQLESRRMTALSAKKALQNRIQQATVRLNAVLADNRVLRTNLENLLKERDKFMLQAQRLEKQLQGTVKRKSDVMDQVTKAYSERDEAQTKMRALRERAERDAQQYTHELKKLQRALDHQQHLRAFVATISAGEEEETSRRKADAHKLHFGVHIQNTHTSNILLFFPRRRRRAQRTRADSNNLQSLRVSPELRNDNYTLFTYISDLNNEVTSLTTEVRRLREQIEDTRNKSAEHERETQRTISQLLADVESADEAVELLEADLRRAGRDADGDEDGDSGALRHDAVRPAAGGGHRRWRRNHQRVCVRLPLRGRTTCPRSPAVETVPAGGGAGSRIRVRRRRPTRRWIRREVFIGLVHALCPSHWKTPVEPRCTCQRRGASKRRSSHPCGPHVQHEEVHSRFRR
ncbi:coiled-coil domain-containing protein 63-like [Penaeus chinensis]|uniref:coiled-coil domain-containing protein 63-like n=1 Tax=Penaeus chinensis TaxID=139456 RepID=UPI001FB60403|nr:coiled-coil domain-containing protein 63-like [Penaeus chinensis]